MNKLSAFKRPSLLSLIVMVLFSQLFNSAADCKNTDEDFFKMPKLVLKEDKGIGSNNYKSSDLYNGTSIQRNSSPYFVSGISLSDLKVKNENKLSMLDRANEQLESSKSLTVSKTDYFSEKYLKKVTSDFKYWESEQRFGTAMWELAIIEFIPWALSKWVTRPGWANVGWQSWWSNIQKGWEYDGDNFLTNNFAHPYHGNLYFNSGRTNGFDFWESVPFAFGGSLLWEYFGEYYRPSFNDWIKTSVSGINLGEMTYRVANLITDNTTRGSQRVWSEIFGALINPVRGFNR